MEFEQRSDGDYAILNSDEAACLKVKSPQFPEGPVHEKDWIIMSSIFRNIIFTGEQHIEFRQRHGRLASHDEPNIFEVRRMINTSRLAQNAILTRLGIPTNEDSRNIH